MRDKKSTIAETAAMGGLKCPGGLGLSIRETHRHSYGDGPRSRATTQKSTPVDRDLANVAMITHHAPPLAERSWGRTFRASSQLVRGAIGCGFTRGEARGGRLARSDRVVPRVDHLGT